MNPQYGGRITAILAVTAALMLGPGVRPAGAAPFCVQTQAVRAQCIFVDAKSCNRRAAEMGGQCVPNPAEVHVSGGVGHYCMVSSNHVPMCIYPDRQNCDAEAKHAGGVCMIAPDRPESPGADPYHDIRPSMGG